jgi:hypothetical protein
MSGLERSGNLEKGDRAIKQAMLAALGIAMLLLPGCAKKPEALPVCTSANSPRSICGLRNPEDLAFAEGSSWLVISQMAHQDRNAQPDAPLARPGSLLAYRVSDGTRRTLFPLPAASSATWNDELGGGDSREMRRPDWGHPSCPGPLDVKRFNPHGIAIGPHASGAVQLAVVSHGGREAVELFEWREDASGEDFPSVRWRGCVPMPPKMMANDLALLSDGGFVVTKFLPPIQSVGLSAMWSGFKVMAGWRTGEVYRWKPGGEVVVVPESGGSAPNGIAVSKDERSVFVAEWGSRRVTRLPLDPAQGPKRESVVLGHHPDNLTWMRDGRLLVAGQGGSVSGVLGCGKIERGGCGLDYGVYAIDPTNLRATLLREGKGAASVALEFGPDIFVGAFTGDQVERFPSPGRRD